MMIHGPDTNQREMRKSGPGPAKNLDLEPDQDQQNISD